MVNLLLVIQRLTQRFIKLDTVGFSIKFINYNSVGNYYMQQKIKYLVMINFYLTL